MDKTKEAGGTPQLITITLYGDGSRNSRLRAEYVSCDRADKCSAFKAGKCFGVTAPFCNRCPYATVQKIDGGLKRSKAYSVVSAEAKQSDKYGKLEYPYHTFLTRIGDEAYITVPFVYVETDGDRLIPKNPVTIRSALIPAKLLTPENLEAFCSFRPRALMGNVITDHQEKTVPMFLLELSRLFPEQYHAFIEAHPEYAGLKPSWIGRYAQLNTCNREKTYRAVNGEEFHFEGDYIVGMTKSMLPLVGLFKNPTEIRIKVTDDMTVRITDDEQVLDTTIFR